MHITINAKDFKLTAANRQYVEEKLSKLTKFGKKIQRIGVELDVAHGAKSGLLNRVEVWVYFPEKTLSAGVKAEHMNEAVDLVYPKIERQITRYVGKQRDKKRPSRI